MKTVTQPLSSIKNDENYAYSYAMHKIKIYIQTAAMLQYNKEQPGCSFCIVRDGSVPGGMHKCIPYIHNNTVIH